MCQSEMWKKNNNHEKLILVPVVVLDEITTGSGIEKLLNGKSLGRAGKNDSGYIMPQAFIGCRWNQA